MKDSNVNKSYFYQVYILYFQLLCLCISAFVGVLFPLHEIFSLWQISVQGFYPPESISVSERWEIYFVSLADAYIFSVNFQWLEFFAKSERCRKMHELPCI